MVIDPAWNCLDRVHWICSPVLRPEKREGTYLVLIENNVNVWLKGKTNPQMTSEIKKHLEHPAHSGSANLLAAELTASSGIKSKNILHTIGTFTYLKFGTSTQYCLVNGL